MQKVFLALMAMKDFFDLNIFCLFRINSSELILKTW